MQGAKDMLEGLAVWVRPEATLQRALARRDPSASSIGLGVATSILALSMLTWIKIARLPSLAISPRSVLLSIAAGWLAGMVVCTASTALVDTVFHVAFKKDGRPLAADRVGHWCCRACVIPGWLLLAAFAAGLPFPRVSPVWFLVLTALILRLLDTEARLLRHVYQMPRRQAYLVVLAAACCVSIGMVLGSQLPLPAISLPETLVLP